MRDCDIVCVRVNGNLIFGRAAYQYMYDGTYDELIGRDHLTLMAHADLGNHWKHMAEAPTLLTIKGGVPVLPATVPDETEWQATFKKVNPFHLQPESQGSARHRVL